MYAPAAARNLSVFFGYDALMMFCHARARKSELDHMAEKREPERAPADVRQVVEEDRDRVEEGAQGRLR